MDTQGGCRRGRLRLLQTSIDDRARGALFAAVVTLCALWTGAALADGGKGGNDGADIGGAGGTGFTGNDGGNGAGFGAAGGGGGGGGAGGGDGGDGGGSNAGTGGLGGTGGSPDGQKGNDSTAGGGAGGGGGGGFNGNGAGAASVNNVGALTGGDGGTGGNDIGFSNSGGGGGGGSGGYGAIVTGSGASINSGTITGGAGGAGGLGRSGSASTFGGDGGDGGVGVQFTATGATFTNSGTVTGGDGGAAGAGGSFASPGNLGAGGTGVVGSGLTVINSGTIMGGLGGDGTTRADAVTFTGGTNNLTLMPGFTITGNVIGGAGTDTLAFAGTGNGTFDLNTIGAGAQQYQNFETFQVDSGTWSFSGSATAAFTVNGGTVKGTGTFGGLTVNGGGTLAPGNSIGTMTVNGAFTLGAGAIFEVEVNAAGQSDKVVVNGTVDITGATLRVLAESGDYARGTNYTIIDNDGTDAVVGTFASITSNLAFLVPTVIYNGGTGNDVVLALLNTYADLCSVAETRNQCDVAHALNRFPSDNELLLAVLNQTAGGARQAFDALSGEIHVSVAGMLADDSRYIREAVLGRLMQASHTNSGGQVAALGAGGPLVASLHATSVGAKAMALGFARESGEAALTHVPAIAFWTRAFGAWADFDSDGDAASADRDLGGFVSGIDANIGGGWRVGLATGASFSNVDVDARYSSANVETYHLAGYAGGTAGSFALRGGGAWAWNNIDTSRAVIFPGFFEQQEASYDAGTGQLFGEIAYPAALWGMDVEPFTGLAYVSVNGESFREHGGALASLRGDSDQDVGYSTLGVRAARTMQWGGVLVTPHLSAAWRHAFNDVTPNATLTFASTGIGFTVHGVPLAEDSALIDAGLDLTLGPRATAGMSYSGQFGDGVADNAVKGRFTWLF